MIVVTEAAMAEMRGHAERCFPEECCGALLGRDEDDGRRIVHLALPCDNTFDRAGGESAEFTSAERGRIAPSFERQENRARRYLIAPDALLEMENEARRLGHDVVGIYHSHPNHPSRPSEFDREHAMPFWSYIILSCMHGQVAQVQSWQLREDRSQFDEEQIA